MNKREWIKKARDYSPYLLASDHAEVSSPDSVTSPGAVYLADIRDAFCEAIDAGEVAGSFSAADRGSLIGRMSSDGGVLTFRTHEIWETFVDLCVYEEEPEDLTGEEMCGEPTLWAARMLGGVAERMCDNMWAEFEDEVDEDADED